MSSEYDEDMDYDTPLIKPDSVCVEQNPAKLNSKYIKMYEEFQKWNKREGTTPVTENVLMKYFSVLAIKKKPSTLWVSVVWIIIKVLHWIYLTTLIRTYLVTITLVVLFYYTYLFTL